MLPALAPLTYVGFLGGYALGFVERRPGRALTVVMHIAVAPAMVFSFIGLGILLPVFAALCLASLRQERLSTT